jgi:hypothetical protein
VGKNMRHALDFVRRYPGWHDFKNDRATVNAIQRLVIRGLVTVSEFHQFRII